MEKQVKMVYGPTYTIELAIKSWLDRGFEVASSHCAIIPGSMNSVTHYVIMTKDEEKE